MRRVPLLSGSRIAIVPVADGDLVLRPPPAPSRVVDAHAAVRDALRFPLSGAPLEEVAPRGGRATIVVEAPALPLPGAANDPRREALAAVIRELELCHVRNERLTILVAGGLARRLGNPELEQLLPPPQARSFHGRVVVHDTEDEHLIAIGNDIRIHPSLVETDLVLTVTAAETVMHGATGALVGSTDAATVRRAHGALSLLEASGSSAWTQALEIERLLSARHPVVGVSLVLDLPRFSGALHGYPEEPTAVEQVARSWSRAVHSRLPGWARREILERQGRRIAATAAFGGTPSVAHAEALVRGVELRGTRLVAPVDALVLGVPWVGAYAPREPVNPVTAAAVSLGLALRLHRNAFPIEPGGTLVLVHPLTRSFAPPDAPYLTMFNALQHARSPDDLASAERTAAADHRAIAAYRAGTSCHPLLPFADWAACAPALGRLGRVVVAGCRDAIAARTLGFVPSHGIGSALQMAHGVAGGRARVGILLAPPYPPLLVG